MPRALRLRPLLPTPPASPGALLHRRRPQVIVRAPGAPVVERHERRQHQPTWPGVGARDEMDTLPVIGEELAVEHEPVSHVRAKVKARKSILPPHAPPPPSSRRRRPVTLLDDVHEALSRDYLAEAARIVASGRFRS